ncbi:alpha/beta hydrolase [Candidatus Micrarchaeota archaeon]|nr:alpha/beta hydrolase [Candidatus Micrarchaeota archaeon]
MHRCVNRRLENLQTPQSIPPKNKTLQRKGAIISYRKLDPDEHAHLPPIALQGGWTMHPAGQLCQIKAFEGRCEIITMENRGHWFSGVGESTARTYLYDLAYDLKAVLDKENIDKIVISGHSMWGAVALIFYGLFPERVAGLMLVTPAYADPRKLGFLRNYPGVYPILDILANSANNTVLDKTKKAISEVPLTWNIVRLALMLTIMPDNVRDVTAFQKLMKNIFRANTDAMALSMQALFQMDDNIMQHIAPRITVPTRIIAGDSDPLISPESAEKLVARIPNAELQIWENTGHLPMLSHPRRLNRTTLEFLQSIQD